MTIVFEAYSPSGTTGTLSGRLPPLRSRISASATPALIGQLPPLRSNISGFQTLSGNLSGRLPPLRSRLSTRAGTSLIGQLPPLRGYFSGAPTPSANNLIATLPPLRANISGFQTIFGTLNGKLPPLRARISTHARPALIAQLPPLRGAFYQNRGNSITLIQSAGYLSIASATTLGQMLQEQLACADALSADAVYRLREQLAMGDTPTSVLEALAAVGENLGFADIVGIAYRMLVAETLALAATPTAWAQVAMQLADALAVAGGAGSTLNAQVVVATAFALQDTLARVWPDTLDESLGLTAAAGTTMQATLSLLDALRVQGQASHTVTFLVQTAESVNLADAVSSTALLQNSIVEGLGLLAQITIDDGSYLAWVVNTATHAPVKYRNFPFNSFAKIGGRYFGAGSDGIYELTGDDDAGEPIQAVLRGGLSDMGTSLLKRMPAMYVGLTTTGRVVLKVTAINPQGEREEHWYSMEERPAGALTESRIKIGKGLKSTYWGWELANVDGADFALDQIAWYPMVLERRLN